MAFITVIGVPKAAANMRKRASNQKRSSRGLMKRVITLYQQTIDKNFITSGRGHEPPKPWKPLKPTTRKFKREHGFSPRPLIRTGTLRQQWARKVTAKRGSITSTAASEKGVFYGKFHEKGTRSKTGKRIVPIRKIIPTKRHGLAIARRVYGRGIKLNIETT